MTRIEMYRTDSYDNWHSAENAGGVYACPVHSVDEPEHGSGAFIMNDIITAITTAVNMMDGNALYAYRVVKETA
jgi:hypothetical protein